jgi:hypothetical protein
MAFQTGTQIRPELADADYSGFVNAASIRAQSLADLGAQIGGAIKARGEKKEKARLNKQAAEMVLGLSQQYGLGIETMDHAKIAVDVFGGGAEALNSLSKLSQDFNEGKAGPSTVKSSEMKNFMDFSAQLGFIDLSKMDVRDGVMYYQGKPISQQDQDLLTATESGLDFYNRAKNRWDALQITDQKPSGKTPSAGASQKKDTYYYGP